MQDSDVKHFEHEELRDLSYQVLIKAGVDEKEAEIISDSLIKANLRGVDSHGIMRLPGYIERAREGLINLKGSVELNSRESTVFIMDGKNKFGQIVTYEAINKAINVADDNGIGIVGVKNSNHLGMGAYFSMMALEHDMIGFIISNSPPTISAWGGAEALMGTNPLSVAIPAGEQLPVVVDMATSMVARGKIRWSANNNKSIPEGWALNKNGEPTTDPEEALDGVLLPFGGPKGYSIALIISILTGVLSGSGIGDNVKSMYDLSGPSNVSHFIGAFNIASFRPVEQFKTDMDRLIINIKNSKKAAGVEEIFLPGEIEFNNEKKRLAEGIPLSGAEISKLKKTTDKYDIKFF